MGVVVAHALVLMSDDSPKLDIIQDTVLSDMSIEGMPQGMESEIKSGSGGNVIAFPSETSSRKFYKLAAE